MRTMFAASLLLFCTCAYALDDTPTQSVYMGPRGEDVRSAVRVRQPVPPPARVPDVGRNGALSAGREPAPRVYRSVPAAPPAVSSGRSEVQPWLAIRQPGLAGRHGQK
ncbi:MAG: hypothetical protein V4578_25430 [Pseudomonadota bacterium]